MSGRRAGLLERAEELGQIDGAIVAARDGRGGVLVLEGEAGIGKTALVQETCKRAERSGMRVLTARGTELEGDFPFGVVRQLFEPALHTAQPSERDDLLSGAAGLAGSVVAPDQANDRPAAQLVDQLHAVVHGLYWLTANLAERCPLLVAVDDAHWSDSSSLRYLQYVARRVEGLPVLVLVATRPQEPAAGALAPSQIATMQEARSLHPRGLTSDAVRELVRARLGDQADEEFAAACHEATGGVPFLVLELLGALAADHVRPTAEAAQRVGELGPGTVAHSTVLQLARLGPDAGAVAQAVAVLGRDAEVGRLATFTDLRHEQVLAALDAMVATHLLRDGSPVTFVHPIVRTAVYDELPAGARSIAHARAARLLRAQAARPEELAAHLLLTVPNGDAEVTATLRGAATAALARGAPESAIVYLNRALSERAQRPEPGVVLYELGSAEALIRDPGMITHLQEALAASADPELKAHIAADLAVILCFAGQWAEGTALVDPAVTESGEHEPDVVFKFEAARAAVLAYDSKGVAEFERIRARSARVVREHRHWAADTLALVLAAVAAARGEFEESHALLTLADDGRRVLAEGGAADWALPQAVGAMIWTEELERAEALAAAALDSARASGSLIGYITGVSSRAWIHAQRGELEAAETDLRAVLELADANDLSLMPVITTLWYCREAIAERPGLADVAALAEGIELEPAFLATLSGAFLLELRGRVRLARRELERGIEDLSAAATTLSALRLGPAFSSWRSTLALARGEGAEQAVQELELARAIGLPRGEGIALRAIGLIEGGERGIERLRESLRVLERSPAALERARTLVELGAALRRANQRREARDQLRAGLDLADRCGAERLAGRALAELHAAGSRPRRREISGPDSLTASEARIARMAADGMSNREIAQALFVTSKTVEMHLSGAYSKLGLSGRGARERLTAALDDG